MSSLTNPYILRIIDLNQEIQAYNQIIFILKIDLEDYKRNPVETVSHLTIENQIIEYQDKVIAAEQDILKLVKFISK